MTPLPRLHNIEIRITALLMLFVSCKGEPPKQISHSEIAHSVVLKYAEGFSISNHGIYNVLTISKPWPEAQRAYRYAVLKQEIPNDFILETTDFDAVFKTPVNTIVATSTTHIPALELLGVERSLIGFPGTDYISSEKTRQRIADGKIRELGKNEDLNTEVLLQLKPDVVVGFGVSAANRSLDIIKKSGIPVIYNGDWAESSALAKAEWIKFFGVLFDKENEADSIFNHIEKEYLNAKTISKQAIQRPTVLSGAMHKAVWYLPNGSSVEAQFLKDANVNYLWENTNGNGSLALSVEVVLDKAKEAQLWLSPSYYTSYKQLEDANTLYSNFDAFKNKNIYSFASTIGKTGGVLYYELGTARPDLVLKDLIKICHPELLTDYTPFFFKPLK